MSEEIALVQDLFFGTQFLPDYGEDDEDSFQGLGEQAFFGHFNFDAVKEPFFDGYKNKTFDHFGINVSFLQTGTFSSDKQEQNENPPETADPTADPDDTEQDTTTKDEDLPGTFSDVAGTVTIEAYYNINVSCAGRILMLSRHWCLKKPIAM